MVPTKAPVVGLKPLMVPQFVLLLIRIASAEDPEIGRRHGKSPGLVEGLTLDQRLHEGSVFIEDVDVSAGLAVGSGEGNIDLAANVLNAEGSEASGQSWCR